MKAILEVEGLGKSFTIHDLGKHLRACRGIDFRVARGEFVGITGKSGSGKSTILKMIYRTYFPDEGVVRYDSLAFGPICLSDADERRVLYLRKHEIGYVSQFLQAAPRTTAREVVEQAVLETGRDEDFAAEQADAMLRFFELDEELRDSYTTTFSGGEKLRLNLARAMVKQPRLLLLDEPTASLDGHSKSKVREILERLKRGGTTMLGIFHDLSFMEGLCDREYAMNSDRFDRS